MTLLAALQKSPFEFISFLVIMNIGSQENQRAFSFIYLEMLTKESNISEILLLYMLTQREKIGIYVIFLSVFHKSLL